MFRGQNIFSKPVICHPIVPKCSTCADRADARCLSCQTFGATCDFAPTKFLSVLSVHKLLHNGFRILLCLFMHIFFLLCNQQSIKWISSANKEHLFCQGTHNSHLKHTTSKKVTFVIGLTSLPSRLNLCHLWFWPCFERSVSLASEDPCQDKETAVTSQAGGSETLKPDRGSRGWVGQSMCVVV